MGEETCLPTCWFSVFPPNMSWRHIFHSSRHNLLIWRQILRLGAIISLLFTKNIIAHTTINTPYFTTRRNWLSSWSSLDAIVYAGGDPSPVINHWLGTSSRVMSSTK